MYKKEVKKMEIIEELKDFGVKLYNFLKNTSTIIGVFTFLSGIAFVKMYYRVFSENELWVLKTIAYSDGIIVLFIGIICFIWIGSSIFNFFRSYFHKHKVHFCVNLFLSILVISILAVLLQSDFYSQRENIINASVLFPQADEFGPVFIQTYASNGAVSYLFFDETPINGPQGYAKITLKTNDYSVNSSAGWIMYLLKGADIRSRYNQLRFLIKGEEGGEEIVIKAKDAKGRENFLTLSGRYLREGRITNDWQQASIPLDDFGDVDLTIIDNFSFATTGSMASTHPQTFYVGEFKLTS
jgi:hypothetical protein